MTDGGIWLKIAGCPSFLLCVLFLSKNQFHAIMCGEVRNRMAKTKYYIKLTDEERALLTKILCEQKESDRTIMRARILLMSEATQPEKVSIKKLAEMLGTTDTTIKTVRTEYAKGGLQMAINCKQTGSEPLTYRPYKRRINDEVVEKIREIASSKPPEGHKRWSTREICKEAMKQGIVKHIAAVTVGKILNREAPYN